MAESLKDYMESIEAGPDVVLEAMKNYLTKFSGFKSPDAMLSEYRQDEQSTEFVNSRLEVLAKEPELLEPAALEILSFAWQDPTQVKDIKIAFQGAKKKMPMMDPQVLQVIALFGLLYMGWLVTVKGRSEETKRVERKPDGSLIEETKIVFRDSPLINLEKLNPFSIFRKDSEGDKK